MGFNGKNSFPIILMVGINTVSVHYRLVLRYLTMSDKVIHIVTFLWFMELLNTWSTLKNT